MGSLVGALLGAFLIKPIGLGITIGSLIGGLLFPSRRKQGPAQFANLQVQTSQKGEPIPVVYGTQRLAGNILWYGNFQRHENAPGGKGGGKGGSPPDPEVRYSASFAVGLCEGPIDGILRIWAGKDEIDMGLEGTKFSIYTGTASQSPDAHIASVMSGTPISVRRESITPPASGAVSDYTAAAPPVASGTAKIFYTHSGGGTIGGGTIRRNYTFVTTTPAADQAWIVNQSPGTLRVGWPAFTAVTNLQFEYQRTVSSSLVPMAYRHTAYVAFKDWDLGPSATVPNFTFEVQRLIGTTTGFTANSEGITSESFTQSVPVETKSGDLLLAFVAMSDQPVSSMTLPAGWTRAVQVNRATEDMSEVIDWRIWTAVESRYTWSQSPATDWNGVMVALRDFTDVNSPIRAVSTLTSPLSSTHYTAPISVQAGDFLYYGLSAYYNGQVTNIIGPSGFDEISDFGTGLRFAVYRRQEPATTTVGPLTWTTSGAGWDTTLAIAVKGLGGPDVNPTDVLSDWIANTRYGVGMTLAQDADTWSAIRTYCKSNDLFVSPVIADRRRGIEHIEHILSYFDGIYVWSQGMSKLKARRVESAVASLSDADYVGEVMPSFGRMAQRETRNRLRLEYSNREDDYNRGVSEASDDWSIADTGERAESIALPGITRTSLAQRWIQRALWNRLPQRIMGKATVGPQRTFLEAGDVITWTHSEVDLRTTRFRVGPIAEAPEQTFGLELIEEPESILGWPAIPGQSLQATDPGPDRRESPDDTLAGVFELPAELPSQWAGVPVLGIAATGPSSLWGGCDIYVSRDGASYTLAGNIRKRAVFGSISSAMPEVPMGGLYDNEFGQTTVDLGISFGSVTALGRADMLAATRLAYVGGEFISFQDVTLVSSYTYALRGMLRGLYDSDVSSKASGSTFFLLGTPWSGLMGASAVQLIPITRDDVGRVIYLKLPSVSIFGAVQDISSVQAMSFTPTGIRLQPDPVSGLQEDNMPSLDVTGQQSLAFVWRYRQQANVEDVEINSGVILGKAADFSTYVARLYTSASSAGAWTANTVAEVTSEAFTFVGSVGQHTRIDVTIRDTDGDESPVSRRVVAVTA